MTVFSHSEPGGHLVNEDSFVVQQHQDDPSCWICTLADGQGGRAGGARASRLACETVRSLQGSRKWSRPAPPSPRSGQGTRHEIHRVSLPSVDDKQIELWLSAPDRKAVSDAANWMERQLKNDPLTKVTAVDDVYFIRRDPLWSCAKLASMIAL